MSDLCLWRKVFMDVNTTTFETYRGWEKEHPLYKCIDCGGLNFDCNGYRPVDDEARRKIIRERHGQKTIPR